MPPFRYEYPLGLLTLAVAAIGDLQLGVAGAAGALAQLAFGVVGASIVAANRIRVLLLLLLLLLQGGRWEEQ